MCEVDVTELGTSIASSLALNNERSKNCGKCLGKNGPPIFFIRKDDPPLCRACFVSQTIHKLRASFGKNNVIKTGDKVCMAFSGGMNSLSLLEMINDCNNSYKRLRFTPYLIHINEDQTISREVENVSKAYGCDLIMVDPPKDSHLAKTRALFKTGLSSTAYSSLQYFERWFRLQLLVEATKNIGSKHLITSESANRLSTLSLSGLVNGRGSNVCEEISFCDNRFDDVFLVRPLYEMLSTQIAFYLKLKDKIPFNNLNSVTNLIIKNGKTLNTLERNSGELIAYLQQGNFPSSVFNILRISSKIDPVNTSLSLKRCRICRGCTVNFPKYDSHKLATEALNFSDSLCKNINQTFKNQTLCHACEMNISLLPDGITFD